MSFPGAFAHLLHPLVLSLLLAPFALCAVWLLISPDEQADDKGADSGRDSDGGAR